MFRVFPVLFSSTDVGKVYIFLYFGQSDFLRAGVAFGHIEHRYLLTYTRRVVTKLNGERKVVEDPSQRSVRKPTAL